MVLYDLIQWKEKGLWIMCNIWDKEDERKKSLTIDRKIKE